MQQTEDQMLAGYVDKMGPGLGTLFHAIDAELTRSSSGASHGHPSPRSAFRSIERT